LSNNKQLPIFSKLNRSPPPVNSISSAGFNNKKSPLPYWVNYALIIVRVFLLVVLSITIKEIASMRATTTKQTNLLKRMKLPVPADLSAASRLLDYALSGNNSRGCSAA